MLLTIHSVHFPYSNENIAEEFCRLDKSNSSFLDITEVLPPSMQALLANLQKRIFKYKSHNIIGLKKNGLLTGKESFTLWAGETIH